MLEFAVVILCMFLEVVTGNSYDKALVSSVETTLKECSTLAHAMDYYVFGRVGDPRRRDEDGLTDQVEGKFETCEAIIQVVEMQLTSSVLWRPKYGTIAVKYFESTFLKEILAYVSKRIGDVLYIASEDGDESGDFHSACTNVGPTIVIIETTTGNIFGGYTDLEWTPAQGTGYQRSTNSFVFGVRPNLKLLTISNEDQGIYRDSQYGPTFGGGHDIHIASGALGTTSNYVYRHAYGSSTDGRFDLNGGQRNFQVKDYAVLKAIAM